MKIKITDSLKAKIFAALLAAGVAAPVAYVATTHTVPSEGFLTHLHLDPVGLKTACVGHLVKKNEVPKQEYTIDECIDMFVDDWKIHQDGLQKLVKVPYRSLWMEGALADFTFNKGLGNVSSSTLMKHLNNRRYDAVCEQLTRWVYGTVNGKKVVLNGLKTRATEQYKFCMGQVPATYELDIQRWTNEVDKDS